MVEHGDTGRRVQEAVVRVVRWANRPDVRAALLGEAGRELSVNDVHLLRAVVANGPVRVSDLADWQGVDKSTISTQVRRLEERELVARRPDPVDRRAVLLSATARGRRLRRRMDDAAAALIDEHLSGWPADDRAAFAELFGRFARELSGGRDG
ncbi:MarR family winged helix-turn-helix transcriptional regulator [Pseudonocardia lacus]|uniref:MarR family winged helix-turn-helix transcriptional regulator n=1 Tax=Pseudonocardia lacus TaxID=2835865 RepID=UPI001BDCFE6B|nr:MarR family transcriptional regulator [Pseudonocardia lacus]